MLYLIMIQWGQLKFSLSDTIGTDTYINYDLRKMICPYCGKTFNEVNTVDKSYSYTTNIISLVLQQ